MVVLILQHMYGLTLFRNIKSANYFIMKPSSLEVPGRSSISVLSCSMMNTKIPLPTSFVTSLATSLVCGMTSGA
jgi:hypothetical protein